MHYFTYNENKKHGTFNFPVAYYPIECKQTPYAMPLHWHREWELIRVTRGEIVFFIDSEEYQAKEGDILLLRSGLLHSASAETCLFECLNFDLYELVTGVPSVREPFRLFYRSAYIPRVHYTPEDKEVCRISDEIFSAFTEDCTDGFRRLTLFGNICRLFAHILESRYYTENTENVSDSTDKNDTLKRVLEYIEAHFSEDIKLRNLSEIAGMNPNYFCRFFQSFTQQTPINYLSYYRVEQAANMLLATDMSVTEIAFRCGFNDTGYFIKAFKKLKGITPRQFRLGMK